MDKTGSRTKKGDCMLTHTNLEKQDTLNFDYSSIFKSQGHHRHVWKTCFLKQW